MNNSQSRDSSGTRDGVVVPVVHWGAASSGAVIGLVVSVVADTLWAAAAFSSHNSAFYNHLAWWFGATLIGATLIGGVVGAGLANARGVRAGAVNGLTSGGLVVLVSAAVALVVAVANGTTIPLVVKGSRISVDFLRPYVAFWCTIAAVAAAGLGGVGGGLIPRRKLADVVPLAAVPSGLLEMVSTASRPASAEVNGFQAVSTPADQGPGESNSLQGSNGSEQRSGGSIAS